MSAIKVGDKVRWNNSQCEVVLGVTSTHAFVVHDDAAAAVYRVPLSDLTVVESAPKSPEAGPKVDLSKEPNLSCGHPASLLVRSVESDDKFCELCRTQEYRHDAETMEARLLKQRDVKDEAIRKWKNDADTLAAELRDAKAEVERLLKRIHDDDDFVNSHRTENAKLREALQVACDTLEKVQDMHASSTKAMSKGSQPYTEPLMWGEYGDAVCDAMEAAAALGIKPEGA